MSEGYNEFGLLQRMDGVMGGAPCLRGSRVSVEFIARRFGAGESIEELAGDYSRTIDEIESAIRLVIVARGTNLDEKRAAEKVAAVLPLLSYRRFKGPASVGAVDPDAASSHGMSTRVKENE